jgi:biofilm protein TabA
MIYDRLENAASYFSCDAWIKAVEYVRSANIDLEDGAHPILGDEVVARVMAYPTKHFQETVLESHRKFVDLQALLAGREYAEVSSASDLSVRTAYSEESDVVFYHPDALGAYCRMALEPGRFAVFFPQDAHRTQLRTGENAQPVKKIVVKIALELLNSSRDAVQRSI